MRDTVLYLKDIAVAIVINDEEDSVRIYPMCSTCETGIMVLGQGQVLEDKDVYIL